MLAGWSPCPQHERDYLLNATKLSPRLWRQDLQSPPCLVSGSPCSLLRPREPPPPHAATFCLLSMPPSRHPYYELLEVRGHFFPRLYLDSSKQDVHLIGQGWREMRFPLEEGTRRPGTGSRAGHRDGDPCTSVSRSVKGVGVTGIRGPF